MAKGKQQELTWEEAAIEVLSKAEGAMHYAEIAAEVAKQGLKSKVGANPAVSIASVFSKFLADENSPFLRVGKGEYTLKDKPIPPTINEEGINVAGDEELETGALRAFGMF